MLMNSKHLTKTCLSRIAEKLELPTKASAEETRQIVEGKLLEMGREPYNVQVELEAREELVWLNLSSEHRSDHKTWFFR